MAVRVVRPEMSDEEMGKLGRENSGWLEKRSN